MKTTHQILLAILLISILIVSRIYSPLANFTAVGAVALFSGFLLGTRKGIAIVLAGMLFSDIFIEGLYDAGTMIAVYAALFVCVFIGQKQINFNLSNVKVNRILSIITKAISAGIVFYFISNLGVWLFSGMYALNLSGLIECYILAIPFYKFTWMGDLAFSLVLFGTYYGITDLQNTKAYNVKIAKY